MTPKIVILEEGKRYTRKSVSVCGDQRLIVSQTVPAVLEPGDTGAEFAQIQVQSSGITFTLNPSSTPVSGGIVVVNGDTVELDSEGEVAGFKVISNTNVSASLYVTYYKFNTLN